MRPIGSLDVILDDPESPVSIRLPSRPGRLLWLFAACDEEWGNDHKSCLGDTRVRPGVKGSCVCGCHRGEDA